MFSTWTSKRSLPVLPPLPRLGHQRSSAALPLGSASLGRVADAARGEGLSQKGEDDI